MVAFLQAVVYNIKELKFPGVAQLGSEATAAGSGVRELSEWLRSADDAGACHQGRCRAPQQEARLLLRRFHFNRIIIQV